MAIRAIVMELSPPTPLVPLTSLDTQLALNTRQGQVVMPEMDDAGVIQHLKWFYAGGNGGASIVGGATYLAYPKPVFVATRTLSLYILASANGVGAATGWCRVLYTLEQVGSAELISALSISETF